MGKNTGRNWQLLFSTAVARFNVCKITNATLIYWAYDDSSVQTFKKYYRSGLIDTPELRDEYNEIHRRIEKIGGN